MFALFPFLSIYLQDIDGASPLGAGLRFLPITVFVFLVPLLTGGLAGRTPMWALLAASLAIVAAGILLMEVVSVGSSWTVLLPGFIFAGIGIGLANPTIPAAALRVVEPTRTGMAAGISNTCRIGALAVGVAGLGAVLQQRVDQDLTSAGIHANGLAAAISSSGLRAVRGRASLMHVANAAFVSGFRLVLLIGCVTVFIGSLAAAFLVRRSPAAAPSPVPGVAAEAER